MALTRLPKNAFATGSVDASKIEDGTIQAVEVSGTLSADKLNATQNLSSKTVTLPNTSVTNDMLAGSIANAKLSNTSITINGTSVALGASVSVGVEVNWQSVITADGSTATTGVAGNGYFIDTTSNAHTFNLPASATLGDQIAIKDYAGTFNTNNLTIGRNGHNIQGVANNSLITTNRASLVLVYVDSTKGWLYVEESNVADLQVNSFISATGGTITTSGDFKIHSFTGDGCFVVSTLGLGPAGGPSNVDYLVVAGGGGGGVWSGGGGAGGYRTTFPSPGCNAGAFPIATQTYPITVGAGGVGSPGPSILCGGPVATSGNPSIFATIISSGGGGAAQYTATPGGSGGGNGGAPTPGGGLGNSPPVSPPQGNPGGDRGGFPGYGGGGGGGAGGAGANGNTPGPGGAGGVGAPNSISGSGISYAGGAGGGSAGSISGGTGGPGSPCGTGGAGSGNSTGGAGTINRGGGGGSGGYAPGQAGGAGGSGIVIIRYKFQ